MVGRDAVGVVVGPGSVVIATVPGVVRVQPIVSPARPSTISAAAVARP
jgi:hypothetical protein